MTSKSKKAIVRVFPELSSPKQNLMIYGSIKIIIFLLFATIVLDDCLLVVQIQNELAA
jgi:hypothetical protein